MKKITLTLVILLLSIPLVSQAKQALTKELISSFSEVSKQWQALENTYPELAASMDEIDFAQIDTLIAKLKNSNAYPKMKSILANTDFNSVEEYYDIAMRVMGGMMAYQMQNMPDGMSVDSMGVMLKNNIAQMKANNVPSAMITEMEQQLANMERSMTMMKSAMDNTSAADKKFINDNAQWVMSVLDDEK